jgi:hypothetical protein
VTDQRVLYVVVCGAGPAPHVGRLVELAQARGWTVQVLATEAAVEHFVDVPALEQQTGRPVRTRYRRPEERNTLPDADAVVVAPATYNTINKWAAGISDTYVLSVLAELTGVGVPIAVLPFVNTALAANAVFHRSVTALQGAGVRVLLGPDGFEPHPGAPAAPGSRPTRGISSSMRSKAATRPDLAKPDESQADSYGPAPSCLRSVAPADTGRKLPASTVSTSTEASGGGASGSGMGREVRSRPPPRR